MERTKRYDFGTPRYAYGELEQALGETFGANRKVQQGALRGRLKRLSTLDLPPGGPGKGSRRLYSWEEANQLLVALLMEDAGLDPIVIVRAIKAIWPKLASKVAAATSDKALAGNPTLLTLRLQTMSGPMRTGDPLSAVPGIGVMPRIDERARTRHAKQGFRDSSDAVVTMLEHNSPGWFAVRNLTAEVSKMQAALHRSE